MKALESDPSKYVINKKEELHKQATIQAYEVNQMEIKDIKEKIKSLLTQWSVSLWIVLYEL